MTHDSNSFTRGSEWRQWDLHIHTPASFHWKGKKFDPDPNSAENRILVDEMINALNNAEPAVFALMDYWTFDGWFALKRRLSETGAPTLTKKVFPGIELRLMAPIKGRLNAHVLFSDQLADQDLKDFKSALKVEIVDQPLSDAALIKLARIAGTDQLKNGGFIKTKIDSDDLHALMAGSAIAEINCESYKTAIGKVPNGCAIGFMPYDTNDGLEGIDWKKHYAYFISLFKSSPIFESRNSDLRDCFLNIKSAKNALHIEQFQQGLGNVPRLVVSGSDAHSFIGVNGNNDKRGYGDFPSGKATWIKADPTFHGLLQAIMEPAKRSFIGARPEKLTEVTENKTYFIDTITITKSLNEPACDLWLDGINIPLNPDLIAIIGNKGSGKSALADVIALLGDSRQKHHFSFLKKDRFRGKSGDPAKNFNGQLTWCDSSTKVRNLNDDPPESSVELVRYIPQGHFEDLCNAHISGQSNAFENELRAVIFSHAGDSIRLGALDFEQLIEIHERGFRDQLLEFRKDLQKINQEIASLEEQLKPEVKSSLLEKLTIMNKQIAEHKKIKPEPLVKPSAELSSEQQEVVTSLAAIVIHLKAIEETAATNTASNSMFMRKLKAIQNIRERLGLLDRAYKQFQDDTEKDLEILALKVTSIAMLTLQHQELDRLTKSISDEQVSIKNINVDNLAKKLILTAKQSDLNAQLNAPQFLYQQNLKTIETWEAKLVDLTGTPEAPETLNGVQTRIEQLDALPAILLGLRQKQIELAGEIFNILDAQRKAREDLFKPVQDLIQNNHLIRDEYKLQFQATLSVSPDLIASALFGLIKQNSREFRGENESHGAIRKLAEQHNFNQRSDVLVTAQTPPRQDPIKA